MIYTSLVGDIDKIRTDIKCFSEYNRFHSSRLNAKAAKILPHMFMPDEEWWIWIDANVFLKHPEQYYIDLAIERNAETLTLPHPSRNNPIEEMNGVKHMDILSDAEWDRLELRYSKVNRLAMGGFIVRKNTESVRASNEKWWAEICCGSVRDQLSFNFCFPDMIILPRERDTRNNYLFTRARHIKDRISG